MAKKGHRGKKQSRVRVWRRAKQKVQKRVRRVLFLGFTGTLLVVFIVGLTLPSFLPTTGRSVPRDTRGGPGEHPTVQVQEHILQGQSHPPYSSIPATSGWHFEFPALWDIYQSPLPDELTVHNLEHGGVAILYDTDNEELIVQLENLARQQRRYPCYLIVAPYPSMQNTIALTAWGAILYFKDYDEGPMQEFIDFYRNQGPEQFSCEP